MSKCLFEYQVLTQNSNTVGSEILPFGNPQTFKIWSFLKIGIQMVQFSKGQATAMVLTI